MPKRATIGKNTGTRMIMAGMPSRIAPSGTKIRMVTTSTSAGSDDSPRRPPAISFGMPCAAKIHESTEAVPTSSMTMPVSDAVLIRSGMTSRGRISR
jgi:hypothetical protein